tara:strand:- start:244 stop:438 length:195 start_codon:yes stop_codon:yes gene_type:complete
MELNLISLFVVIYLATLLSDFTFFLFNIVMQYYRMRNSKKQMDILKRNLEEIYGKNKNDDGGKK